MVPARIMATTFEANSKNAPYALPQSPAAAVIPATARGGTREIAIATPGMTSGTSLRASPYEPAKPVAMPAIRSMTLGEVRLVTCPFEVSGCNSGRT